MRTLVAIALVMLGASSPRHRRFQQKDLKGPSASSCVPRTGAAFVTGNWGDLQNAGTITRTANVSGTTPGCDSTWERLQIPATTASQYSSITAGPSVICPFSAVKVSIGLWAQATSAGGTTDFGITSNSVWTLGPVAFTSTATFFKFENLDANQSGAGTTLAFGNLSLVNGGTARSAADVKVWGIRCIAGATISQ